MDHVLVQCVHGQPWTVYLTDYMGSMIERISG